MIGCCDILSLFTPASTPEDGPQTYSYKLTSHLTYAPSHVATLALIKRGPTLDPITPLASQLHFLNHFGGEETPYESLHAVVSCGVKPWFDAFVGARGGAKDGDPKMGEGRVACSCLVLNQSRHTHDQEEIRGTRTVTASPSAKC